MAKIRILKNGSLLQRVYGARSKPDLVAYGMQAVTREMLRSNEQYKTLWSLYGAKRCNNSEVKGPPHAAAAAQAVWNNRIPSFHPYLTALA